MVLLQKGAIPPLCLGQHPMGARAQVHVVLGASQHVLSARLHSLLADPALRKAALACVPVYCARAAVGLPREGVSPSARGLGGSQPLRPLHRLVQFPAKALFSLRGDLASLPLPRYPRVIEDGQKAVR